MRPDDKLVLWNVREKLHARLVVYLYTVGRLEIGSEERGCSINHLHFPYSCTCTCVKTLPDSTSHICKLQERARMADG